MTAARPEIREVQEELGPLAAKILAEMCKEPAAGFLTDAVLGGLAARAACAAAAYAAPVVDSAVALALAKPVHFCGGCGRPQVRTASGVSTLHREGCKGDRS